MRSRQARKILKAAIAYQSGCLIRRRHRRGTITTARDKIHWGRSPWSCWGTMTAYAKGGKP